MLAIADRRIDPERMAVALNVSVAEVERRLAIRRRTTARAVYLYMSTGSAFLVVWLYKIVGMPDTYSDWLYVAGLLSMCTAFALAAVYNCMVNWQIRSRYLGSFTEFLVTQDTWWPS